MYELQVDKMGCGGCAKSVSNSILSVDKNANVTVDLKTKSVRVDTELPLDAVAKAIIAAGFPILASAVLPS